VRELVETHHAKLRKGLTAVVFSKDRPMQLFALLTSYIRHVSNPVPLVVVYSASSVSYADAYLEVCATLGEFVEISLIDDTQGFRNSLLDVLAHTRTRNVLFFVDDIVFIRPVDLQLAQEIDPSRYILSLRHGPHLSRSYTANTTQQPPNFGPSPYGADTLTFRWFAAGNEWSNPWSVDGQVLSTAEVAVMTRVSDFIAPNSYEGALTSFNDLIGGRMGLCYKQSKILNLAINRVQKEVKNRCGGISCEFLQEQWQKGWAIDTTVLDMHIPTSPHEDHAVSFVPRADLLRTLRSSVHSKKFQ